MTMQTYTYNNINEFLKQAEKFLTPEGSEKVSSTKKHLYPNYSYTKEGIEVDVPGVESLENISLEVEQEVLIVSADRKIGDKEYKYEICFELEDRVDRAAISAKYVNGVLKIALTERADYRKKIQVF